MNFHIQTKAAAILLMLTGFLPQMHSDTVLPYTQFTFDGESFKVDVATDFHDNAIAVYQDGFTVYATYSADGGFWQDPIPLSVIGERAGNPVIAMDASGTALAAWATFGSTKTIDTAFFSNGTWSTPSPNPLDSSTVNFDSLSIAMNGSGKGLAVWSDNPGDAFASFFTNGMWSPVTQIATGIFGDFTVDAFSPNGTAAALSISSAPGPMAAANYNGTGWTSEIIDSDAQSDPSLGIDANGNAIGVWLSGPNPDVVVSRFNGTSWSPLLPISNGMSNSPPSVAVAPDGTAVALWVDGSLNVQFSKFNGTSWSAPIFVAPNAQPSFSGNSVVVAVTMDLTGDAFLVWPSNNQQLMGALLLKGGVLGTPAVLATVNTLSVYLPIYAALSDPIVGWAVWGVNQVEASNTFGTSIFFSPSLPIGTGSVCVNKFATQTDRINVITFTPSTDPTASYQLTRDGVLIATIPPTGPFTYFDHNRCKGVTYTYTITAISPLGGPSTVETITIKA